MTGITTVGLEDAIQKAIKQYVEDETRKAIQEVKSRLDADLPRIAAEVAVSVGLVLSPHSTDTYLQIRLTPKL